MLIGDCCEVTFRGKPALLYVLRNNGECWGRLIVDGDEFDVETSRDHYDDVDEVALIAFERAARKGRIAQAIGWLGQAHPT